jgi:hypothetical protein
MILVDMEKHKQHRVADVRANLLKVPTNLASHCINMKRHWLGVMCLEDSRSHLCTLQVGVCAPAQPNTNKPDHFVRRMWKQSKHT